ncbi:hypothetical protein [Streptomyces sp. NPDC001221]
MDGTFVITGVGRLGGVFAQERSATGDCVIGTVGKSDGMADFPALAPAQAGGRLLEVIDGDAVVAVVGEVVQRTGALEALMSGSALLKRPRPHRVRPGGSR